MDSNKFPDPKSTADCWAKLDSFNGNTRGLSMCIHKLTDILQGFEISLHVVDGGIEVDIVGSIASKREREIASYSSAL